MNNTHTFKSVCGRFQFTIKDSFLKKTNPAEHDVYDLMTQHQMAEYLHNPVGPAIVVFNTTHEEYWLNGKRLDAANAEKIKHDFQFNNKVMGVLDEQ
jgi:hypothetical protein